MVRGPALHPPQRVQVSAPTDPDPVAGRGYMDETNLLRGLWQGEADTRSAQTPRRRRDGVERPQPVKKAFSRRPWANPQRLDMPLVFLLLAAHRRYSRSLPPDYVGVGIPNPGGGPRYGIPAAAFREQVLTLYRAGAVELCIASKQPGWPSRPRLRFRCRLTPEVLQHPDAIEHLWKAQPADQR